MWERHRLPQSHRTAHSEVVLEQTTMNDKPKFNKKLYRERVKQFKASFSQFIVEKKFLDPAPEPGSYVT